MNAGVSSAIAALKRPLRPVSRAAMSVLYHGNGRYCPLCDKSARAFRQHGFPARDDAQCPHCGSLERHRLLWVYLQRRTNFFTAPPARMLHVAPEGCFEARFQSVVGAGYLTADISDPNVMVKMDVTSIDYADEYFDVIYCAHVLEHVVDDRRAMHEFRRVLKGGGWAILLVPIAAEVTYEDAAIVDPADRLQAFGQRDHVRIYGRDYVDRLRECGFAVEVVTAQDLLSDEEALEMGITAASGEIYCCTR